MYLVPTWRSEYSRILGTDFRFTRQRPCNDDHQKMNTVPYSSYVMSSVIFLDIFSYIFLSCHNVHFSTIFSFVWMVEAIFSVFVGATLLLRDLDLHASQVVARRLQQQLAEQAPRRLHSTARRFKRRHRGFSFVFVRLAYFPEFSVADLCWAPCASRGRLGKCFWISMCIWSTPQFTCTLCLSRPRLAIPAHILNSQLPSFPFWSRFYMNTMRLDCSSGSTSRSRTARSSPRAEVPLLQFTYLRN